MYKEKIEQLFYNNLVIAVPHNPINIIEKEHKIEIHINTATNTNFIEELNTLFNQKGIIKPIKNKFIIIYHLGD